MHIGNVSVASLHPACESVFFHKPDVHVALIVLCAV